MTKEHISLAEILRPLARYQPGILDARDDVIGTGDPFEKSLQPAAVMVPLVALPDGPAVILTRRSASLRHHPGQISFPGGRPEPHDGTPWDTALRETVEEIGLNPKQFTPVSPLDRYRTLTGYEITPWLAMVEPPLQFHAAPSEVAEIFTLPLAVILNPSAFDWQERQVNGFRRGYYVMQYLHHVIWGATADILVNFSRILNAAHEIPNQPESNS